MAAQAQAIEVCGGVSSALARVVYLLGRIWSVRRKYCHFQIGLRDALDASRVGAIELKLVGEKSRPKTRRLGATSHRPLTPSEDLLCYRDLGDWGVRQVRLDLTPLLQTRAHLRDHACLYALHNLTETNMKGTLLGRVLLFARYYITCIGYPP
jgi:hypothetical protein